MYFIYDLYMQVSRNGLTAYVCDLGLAMVRHQMSVLCIQKGQGAGTVCYKAPEMFSDSKRSTPLDIYSFGCLLIETSVEGARLNPNNI